MNKNAGNTFLGIDIGGTRIKAGIVFSKLQDLAGVIGGAGSAYKVYN